MWANRSYEMKRRFVILAAVLSFAVISALLTVKLEYYAVFFALLFAGSIIFTIALFSNPKVGFLAYLVYCFIIAGLLKNTGLPFGPLMEVLLGVTWLSLLYNHKQIKWKEINNDHLIIALIWFSLNIIELVNPEGASLLGWLNEVRFTALNWLLVAPLGFLLFKSKRDLDIFFMIIISLSVLGTLYGIKQYFIGVSAGEQRWLDEGGATTHIIDGRLRVFSFYTDAGQFGASQAAMAAIALVMAFGPFKRWKKILLGISGLILFYGMLISGTRGAFFALVVAGVFAVSLSKNFKVLFSGLLLGLAFFGFLKYTTIGSGNYQIVRLRTAVDPQNDSFNARLINQSKLKELMKDKPFGAGVGSIGLNGIKFNSEKYLSNIPPDSYWVKIWVMYGPVGLVIWFSLIMFMIGKCCGTVWNIQDNGLKVKCIALTSGTAGLFFCSYANEVMNGFPSVVILYMSWSFVLMANNLDEKKVESIKNS